MRTEMEERTVHLGSGVYLDIKPTDLSTAVVGGETVRQHLEATPIGWPGCCVRIRQDGEWVDLDELDAGQLVEGLLAAVRELSATRKEMEAMADAVADKLLEAAGLAGAA